MLVMLISLVMAVIHFRDVLELQEIEFDTVSFILSIIITRKFF